MSDEAGQQQEDAHELIQMQGVAIAKALPLPLAVAVAVENEV